MPTYVYRRADGTTFELFQRITDDPLTADPETGQPVARVISGGVGVQFKGSGFYETDYVRKSDTQETSRMASEGAASESASTTDSASSSSDSSPSSATSSAGSATSED